MTKRKQQVIELTEQIESCIHKLINLMADELQCPEKLFSVDFKGEHFEFHYAPDFASDDAREQYKLRTHFFHLLLNDAFCKSVKIWCPYPTFDFTDGAPWKNIIGLVSGADPEDHKFEIIKETYIPDLDKQGNPITAKPLNQDSIYVQWQDENRFKFEENK
jgi:hypothetical protein